MFFSLCGSTSEYRSCGIILVDFSFFMLQYLSASQYRLSAPSRWREIRNACSWSSPVSRWAWPAPVGSEWVRVLKLVWSSLVLCVGNERGYGYLQHMLIFTLLDFVVLIYDRFALELMISSFFATVEIPSPKSQ